MKETLELRGVGVGTGEQVAAGNDTGDLFITPSYTL